MSQVVDYIRNMDIRKVAAVIGFMMFFEQGIVDGKIILGGVPSAWMDIIKIWCNNFVYLNAFILVGHPLTAAKWPEPPAITTAVKAAVAIFAVLLASLIFAMSPAMAQSSRITGTAATRKAPAKPALCDPLNLLPGCKNPDGSTAPANAVDPLTFLRQFSYTDLNNALTDANAQTPPNKTSASCWAYLLTLVPAPAPAASSTGTNPTATPSTDPSTSTAATSLLPTTPGIASAIQKALDDQQLLVTWLSPGGGLEQLNLACAPLVNMVNARLLTGGTVTAAAAAALTNPATAPLIAGLGTLLTGVIALAPK
jgi:hypothetical protein